MLGKLLKHDFKSMGRILLPLYGAVIVLGLFTSFFIKFPNNPAFQSLQFLKFIFILIVVSYCILVFGSGLLSLILSITSFKKTTLETEGYLTHTLPVDTWQIILSKVITAFVYELLSVIAAGISGLIILLVNSHFSFNELFNGITMLFAEINKLGGIVYLTGFEALIISIISVFGLNLMFYASLSIGFSANSRKMLKAVATFIGFYFVTEIINYFLLYVGSHVFQFVDSTPTEFFNTLQPIMLIVLVVELGYAAAYFFITNYFLKNKLNLQ